jgi:cytochrome c peroxidase
VKAGFRAGRKESKIPLFSPRSWMLIFDESPGRKGGSLAFRSIPMIFAIVVLIALPPIDAHAHSKEPHGSEGAGILRYSDDRPDYEPPAPGSYRLPPIQRSVDGKVIDADGREHNLFDLMNGKCVLLSFIYTGCFDPKGCPLALHVLNAVREKMEEDSALSGKVILITLSFDPENDTPEAMRRFADESGFAEARARRRWLFLTTSSSTELQPLLDGYGQYVVRETDANGRHTGGYSHVLKVYLIDSERRVRNIYSTSFLYPDLILGDIMTLTLEKDGNR